MSSVESGVFGRSSDQGYFEEMHHMFFYCVDCLIEMFIVYNLLIV